MISKKKKKRSSLMLRRFFCPALGIFKWKNDMNLPKILTQNCPKDMKSPEILTQNCPKNMKSPKILTQNRPKYMKLPEISTPYTNRGGQCPPGPPPPTPMVVILIAYCNILFFIVQVNFELRLVVRIFCQFSASFVLKFGKQRCQFQQPCL